MKRRGRGGMGGVGAACRPYVLLSPRPLAPAPPKPRAGWRQSAAGAHARQRGESPKLRGQAAGQAVAVKPPASERGTSGG